MCKVYICFSILCPGEILQEEKKSWDQMVYFCLLFLFEM